jgi:hypothetical protein
MAAVSAEGSTVWVLMRRLNSSCSRSMAFVTGMRICGAYLVRLGSGLILAYGATIRDKGHREHALWVGRRRTMSCELVLVAGRPCDLPGCAVSADP